MDKLFSNELCNVCGKLNVLTSENINIAEVEKVHLSLSDDEKIKKQNDYYKITYFVCDCGCATVVQVDTAESYKLFVKNKKSYINAVRQLKANETVSPKETNKRIKYGKKLQAMREANKEEFYRNINSATILYFGSKKLFEFPLDKHK